MKIPGIAYIILGIFISIVSGIVYKFIPKPDGTPNMSMALFFFIGIIFILIGVIKSFFRKAEDVQDTEYHKVRTVVEKQLQQEAPRRNRVEEQLNRAEHDVTNHQGAHTQTQHQHNAQHHQHTHEMHHTSAYAKTHPYHGVHETQNAEQTSAGQTASHPASSMHFVACKRCGDQNPSTANYCHSCGYRLG